MILYEFTKMKTRREGNSGCHYCCESLWRGDPTVYFADRHGHFVEHVDTAVCAADSQRHVTDTSGRTSIVRALCAHKRDCHRMALSSDSTRNF